MFAGIIVGFGRKIDSLNCQQAFVPSRGIACRDRPKQ